MLFSEQRTGDFVGLVDVSRLTDTQFAKILETYHPRYVFDARVAPYLNIGRLHRHDVFELFASVGATYLYALPREAEGRSENTAHEVSIRLLEEWSTGRGPWGVVLVFLQATDGARELRQSIRRQFVEHALRPPSIRILNPD